MTVRTSGGGSDSDHFQLLLDGLATAHVGDSESPVYLSASVGEHQAVLLGVAPNCVVDGDDARAVLVSPGDTAAIDFQVVCHPDAASLQVTAKSTGADIDPSGYTIVLDGAGVAELGPTTSITLSVAAGPHELALEGLNANCAVQGNDPRAVELLSGAVTRVDYQIACNPAPPAGHGNELAFVSNRPDSTVLQLYLMNSDGSNVRQLLPDSTEDQFDPDWTPGGDRLVFATNDFSNPLKELDATGGGVHPIVITGSHGQRGPRWSPDGSRIAYTDQDDTQTDLFTITTVAIAGASGESPRLLEFPTLGLTAAPTWSPDGTRIAFQLTPIDDTPDGECCLIERSGIYTATADGSGFQEIVPPSDTARHPAWSPDGAHIAYSSQGDLYLIGPAGGERTQLTSGPGNDDRPAWSPDGSRIAFSSDRNGNREIYVIDVNGSNLTRLTNDPANDDSPAWRP